MACLPPVGLVQYANALPYHSGTEAQPRQGRMAAAPYGARPRRPAERNSREQKELAQPQRFLNQFQPVQDALGLVAGLVVLGVGDVFFGVLDFLRQRGLVEIG